jgi:hypothetical protein
MVNQRESEACMRFLELIRGDSAYPRIRKRIASIYGQILALGIILILVGVIALAVIATPAGQRNPAISVIIAAVAILLGLAVIEFAKYVREKMSMQVDMADSLLRIGTRTPHSVNHHARVAPVADLSEAAIAPASPRSEPPMSSQVRLEAAPGLRNASDRDEEGEARYLLIRAKDRIRVGQRSEAIELMREVVAKFPCTSAGQKAAEQLQRHGLA